MSTSEPLSLRLEKRLNAFHEDLKAEIARVISMESDPEQAAQLVEDSLLRDKARISELEGQCNALEAERDLLKEGHHPRHIVVLIDGDGVIFELDRIAQGHAGGMQAGKDLSAGLEKHFGSTPHRPLSVYLFFNKKGLYDTFGKLGRPDAQENLEGFVVGFNEAATGYMIVDVGRNKEAADAKIKVLLEKEVTSPQTEFIVFGGCHDGGYISNLNTHITRGFGPKLHLLQGYDKPAWVIKNLNLPLIQIPGLFVKEKIDIVTGATPFVSPAPNSGGLGLLPPVDLDEDTLSPSLSRFPAVGLPSTPSHNPQSRPTSMASHRRNMSSSSGVSFNTGSSTYSTPARGDISLQPSPIPRKIDLSRELWKRTYP
ncbi:hypothetical protein D9611_006037 [Ephemerocybe angulata]|uniref:DUF7923 domain-containing protein n=1 Tax=Ephemerocybe angulata TaxID=980116 RepID=A0A8H5FKW3_9AGAR|nr:hypothetical protein D9611_006037 [Tulosesus angulatus]